MNTPNGIFHDLVTKWLNLHLFLAVLSLAGSGIGAEKASPALNRGVWRSLAECEAKAREHGARWDGAQQSPWYCYRDGDAFVQGWFNDAQAWKAKLSWVKEQGLGGIGIWVLDGVNDPPETWEALRQFSGVRSAPRSEPNP